MNASACECPAGNVTYDDGASCVPCPPGFTSLPEIHSAYCARMIGSGLNASVDGDLRSASFLYPSGLAMVNSSWVVVAELGAHVLRAIDLHLGAVLLLAGRVGIATWKDGNASDARFNGPCGLLLLGSQDAALLGLSSVVLVADGSNNRIRLLDLVSMTVDTLAGTGAAGLLDGRAYESRFSFPSALAAQAGFVYVTDTYNMVLRRISLETRMVTTVASGLAYPVGVAVLPGQHLAISDQLRSRCRRYLGPLTF